MGFTTIPDAPGKLADPSEGSTRALIEPSSGPHHGIETTPTGLGAVVKTDDTAVVEGTQGFIDTNAIGVKRPSLKVNLYLSRRIEAEEQRHHGKVRPVWVKGHADRGLVA